MRAIVSVAQTIDKAEVKAQVEGGVGHDQARAFGPFAGSSPLPSSIFSFDFHRTFHPYRVAAGVSYPIATAYRLQVSLERNVTVFYGANEISASLVRHR